MADTQIAALFDLKRFNVLATWLNPQTTQFIEPALAWAYYARLCPIHHLDEEIADPFASVWEIAPAFVEQVAALCDERWNAEKMISFTEIEDYFGGRSKRLDLVAVLRYEFLHNEPQRPSFYKGLQSQWPVEAHRITRVLSPKEIYLK